MSGVPLSSGQLVASVLACPRPLLFLDTAAILDVIRVPLRHELQPDIVTAAATIVRDARSGPRQVWAVSTANVLQEFGAARTRAAAELMAHMKSLNHALSRLSAVATLLFPEHFAGSPAGEEAAVQDRLSDLVENRLLKVMDELADSLVIFEGTPDCVFRARNRVFGALPPASKSGQQYKDCEIFEEFLELLTALRRRGFNQPAVFITPNSKDYGPPPDGHPRIASDLAPCTGTYAAHLSWACNLIRSLPA